MVDPFARSGRARPVATSGSEHHPTFAQNLVNAIVPQPRTEHDRREHYIARAEDAQRLAAASDEQRIKVIHLEMAARYYSLANHHVERPAPMSLVG